MKKIKYNYDEEILETTLENGLKVYMYPTNKTRNYYVTVSTHFGAEVMKYKKKDKVYDVTLGSAHFLEHRVMDFTKNESASKALSEYGSLVNAYTTYNGTNYNLFGKEAIIENMTLLFDRVFKANIKEEDVEKERGIILEEYYMYFDDPYFILHNNLNKNMFRDAFIKYPVIGTTQGIKGVKTSELRRLYKDFYTPDNMFIVVSGAFDKEKVLKFIEEYTKDIKGSKEDIEVIKPKEKDGVPCEYEEVSLAVNEPKIIVGYKFPVMKGMPLLKQKLIFKMCLSNQFGLSGEALQELERLGIKRNTWGFEQVDDYFYMYFKASTTKCDEFLEVIEKYLKNLTIDKEALDRKKRSRLSSLILAFEDIIGIEDMITTELFTYNKLNNKKDEIIKEITLSDAKKVIDSISLKDKSILKIVGK